MNPNQKDTGKQKPRPSSGKPKKQVLNNQNPTASNNNKNILNNNNPISDNDIENIYSNLSKQKFSFEPCANCQIENGERTFIFSCSHNICLNCMLNHFIFNNFNGLKLEEVSIECPVCSQGEATFSIDMWMSFLNQIFYKKNNNNEIKENINNNNNNQFCEIHKNQLNIKYCKQCKKYLCETCMKENHNKKITHIVVDKNKMTNQAYNQALNQALNQVNNQINNQGFDSVFNFEGEYKDFEMSLQKKETLFFEKIENEYILKKTRIEDLIRQLNQLLTNYTIQMNDFQNSMQKVFYIINLSYYNFFSSNEKNQKTQSLNKPNELLDIKLISQNMLDINEMSNYFYKKSQEVLEQSENIFSDNSPLKYFNFELLFDSSIPEQKIIFKNEKKKPILIEDSVTKLIQLKKSNDLIASSLINGNIYLWDLRFKKIIFSFEAHKSSIWSLLELNNGYIATGSSDKTIKIFDIIHQNDTALATLKGHRGTIFCLSEIENNKLVSGSEDKTLKIWDLSKNQCILTLKDPNKAKINCLVPLKNSNFILTGNDDNLIKIWDINSGTVVSSLKGHDCTVWCLANFADDELLASGSSDNVIRIWDLVKLKYLYSLEGHENTISAIKILKDELLASASWDTMIKIWNLNTRSCIYNLSGHEEIVWDIIELKNGDLVSCSNDKKIIVWGRK